DSSHPEHSSVNIVAAIANRCTRGTHNRFCRTRKSRCNCLPGSLGGGWVPAAEKCPPKGGQPGGPKYRCIGCDRAGPRRPSAPAVKNPEKSRCGNVIAPMLEVHQ